MTVIQTDLPSDTRQSLDSDWTLLQDFIRDGSRWQLERLIQRHINMVYSTALRDVRDPHLAQDVTQAVFVVLLGKASKIRQGTVLGGWLFRTTRFCARDALKRERRRDRHEREAAAMKPSNGDRAAADAWDQIRPLLNEGIASLHRRDRDAIVMRYLENNTVAEVARRMHSTEAAARQRLFRAVGKLRQFFARRGLGTAVSPAVLGIALDAHAAALTAPAVLLPSTAHTAIAGAQGVLPVSSTIASIAKGACKMMNWINIKIIAATVGGGVVAAVGTAVLIAGTGSMPGSAAPSGMVANPTVALAALAAPPNGAAASQPAQAQAPAKSDLSSPLAALRTEKQALVAGDAPLLKSLYYTADPAEQKTIDVIMDQWASMVRFQEACAVRFGQEASQRVAPGFNLFIPPEAREQINGENGTLYHVGGPQPTTLRRIEGQWKFTYASLVDNNFRDLPPMPPESLAEIFQLNLDLYQQITKDVANGKFARIEDAVRALRDRRQALAGQIDQIVKQSAPALR